MDIVSLYIQHSKIGLGDVVSTLHLLRDAQVVVRCVQAWSSGSRRGTVTGAETAPTQTEVFTNMATWFSPPYPVGP